MLEGELLGSRMKRYNDLSYLLWHSVPVQPGGHWHLHNSESLVPPFWHIKAHSVNRIKNLLMVLNENVYDVSRGQLTQYLLNVAAQTAWEYSTI